MCPNGQVQAGTDPVTNQPICIPATGAPQTGGTVNPAAGNNWWSPIVTALPGMLSGVADIIGANKGIADPNPITIYQNQPQAQQEQKREFPWGVFLVIGLVLIVVGAVFLLVKKKQ